MKAHSEMALSISHLGEIIPLAREFHGASREEYVDTSSNPQITQIFKKVSQLDRLKKWEPVRDNNKLAHFCAPGVPIALKAQS